MCAPLADADDYCKRLASSGVMLNNVSAALETFALKFCVQDPRLVLDSTGEGGLSHYCAIPRGTRCRFCGSYIHRLTRCLLQVECAV
jgi:hypothetical protein